MNASHSHLAIIALSLGLFTTGCRDLPDFRYETAHLRIATEFDEPLCRGNLDHLERVVVSLEQQLDTRVDVPVDVYIWDPRNVVNPGWCTDDFALGCYADGSVRGDLQAIDHELVHAVIATFGAPAAFWGEGAAEALQSARTLFGPTTPLANLELEPPELSYQTAGHFSRWLVETHGIERYRSLLRSSDGTRAAFEQTYGMSMEEAQSQYLAEAPHSYGALLACEHPELEQLDPATWSEAVQVDCAEPSVWSSPFGMASFRTLTIPTRGNYTFVTSAEVGTIARCNDEDLDAAPEAGDPAFGDVPPVTENFIYQYERAFAGDSVATTYDLAPGRYEISVGFSSFTAAVAQLEVRATGG